MSLSVFISLCSCSWRVVFSCVMDFCFSFFFFFKQKTAYEMRISDWSSDVCSSDLGDGRGFFVADDRVERGDQDRVAVERGSHVVAAHLHPGDGGVGEQARDVGQHAYRVEQVRRDQRQRDVELEVAGLPGNRDRRMVAHHLGARSEEHTSELQSL